MMHSETMHIYHLNDVHSHFHNWSQMSRFLREMKAKHEAEGERCLILDLGDFVDRSHPLTEATYGRANITLLNEAGVDVVTIGNNEGITMAHEHLEKLYDDATFDVVVANVYEPNGNIAPFAKRYVIREWGEFKIALFGVTAPYPLFYEQLGWRVTDPYEEVASLVEELTPHVDVMFCLSHVGEPFDREIAKRHPQLTVIFGAHTHHLFPEGERVRDSLLVATGKYAQYIGHVTVRKDRFNGVETTARVIETDRLPKVEGDTSYGVALIERGKRLLDEPVFRSDLQLTNDLFKTTELDRFFGRALIAYTKADCAMFNSGIFLRSLQRGNVTKEQLHELLPHPINVSTVEVNGAILLHMYEKTKSPDWPHIEVRGLGFRGTVMGKMNFERLFEQSEGTVYIGNRRIRRDETYKVATLDMFTFGYFFPELNDVEKTYYMPELIRDVFGWYGMQTNESV